MKKFVMKAVLFAVIPAVALGLGAARAHAATAPGNAPLGAAAGQDRPWDAPPAEFDDLNRRAFEDGIDAAQSDFLSGRRMDPNGSPNFKHPPVPKPMHEQYRASFSRGYEAARLRSVYMREHPGTGWEHDRAHGPQ